MSVSLLKNTDLFDAQWYGERYRDVVNFPDGAEAHYLKYGWKMGRDPGPEFSTQGYLDKYPDVIKAGVNPLIHFLQIGLREGRVIEPAGVKTTKVLFDLFNNGCDKRLAVGHEPVSTNEKKLADQLDSTQQLLEFYYKRCQELSCQSLDGRAINRIDVSAADRLSK